MAVSLSGVCLQAFFPALVRWSYPLFIISAGTWLVNGIMTRNRPLAQMQAVLVILNIIAVYRWFF
jgi:hypothetical protein